MCKHSFQKKEGVLKVMWKIILKIIAWIVFLPVLFLFVGFIATRVFFNIDTYQKVRVSGEVSDWFPVAVLSTPAKDLGSQYLEVVFYGELDNYLSQLHKEDAYTFIIPKTLEKDLNKQVLERCQKGGYYPSKFNSNCSYKSIEIVQSMEGSQLIKAKYESSEEYINHSWYEATDSKILPKYHQHFFGPGVMIGLLIYSGYITMALYSILLISYLVFVLRKKKKQ